MTEQTGAKALSAALEWLYGTQTFGVKLGLDGMCRLATALGIDFESPVAPRFIHVAGTNGKGSTCAMIHSICRAAGLRTGLYTSPHLVSLRERFRLDGELISDEALCAGLERIRKTVSGWQPHPTFFEIVTGLALEWFQRSGARYVVLETGMGGRLDATNIVTPVVSVLTPIGLDHQQHLGETLAQIAGEKAGIIKAGVPVVSAPQREEALEVFQRVAAERNSSLEVVSHPWSDGSVGLAGGVQRWNAALAVAAVKAMGAEIEEAHVSEGLASVQWPGRFQVLAPDLVLDGAHNPAAAATLVETWREQYPNEKASVLFASLEDKDTASVLRCLAPIAAEVVLVPVNNPRSCKLGQLRRIAESVFGGRVAPEILESPDLLSALQRVPRGRRLATGSLYLVGEVLALHAGIPREPASH